MIVCAFAPSVWFLVVGASLVGIGGGSFLAVDWALMTDIIPKASAGRYMGISNVATATNGVVAGLVGYVIVDRFAGAGRHRPRSACRLPAGADLVPDRGLAAPAGR